jgi:hypothetical protein
MNSIHVRAQPGITLMLLKPIVFLIVQMDDKLKTKLVTMVTLKTETDVHLIAQWKIIGCVLMVQ